MSDVVLRRNHVRIQGQDRGLPALVFVNGFGCEQSIWRSVASQFAPSRRIILFDHFGTGRTELTAADRVKYSSLQGYADDLLEVCDAVGARDAVLIGHGVGGIIGLLAAIRWPAAFRQLILIDPSPCLLNHGSYLGGLEQSDLDALLGALDSDFPRWARQMAPLIVGHPDRPELAWELASSMSRLNPAVASQFARVSFGCDHRDDLQLVSTPTTILQSADDIFVPEVVGEFMQETIPGSVLLKLDATGHCPQLSEPEEVVHALRALLDESWSETAPSELGSAR